MSSAATPSPSPEPRHRQRRRTARRPVARAERSELLEHVEALLEPLMVGLGFAFLALLLIDYGVIDVSATHAAWASRVLLVLWGIFVLEFALRFAIAPAKLAFLRANWLSALSLALPFLRPLRVLGALRAVRSLSLVRLLGGVNRGMRTLRKVSAGHAFAYVASLSVLVALAGAAGVWYFDRGNPTSPIQSFGDAIWWGATLVTTMNSEKYVVTPEARIIGLLMRLYALSVFGYVTATIAAYFVGRDAAAQRDADAPDAVREQLALLRQEVTRLREELVAREPTR